MPILNIRDMGVGVITDIAPWDLPPSALSYGINYRMSNGKIQTAGGIQPASPPCGDQLGHITQSTDYSNASTWVVCGANSIKTFDGLEFRDASVAFRSANPKFSGLDPTLWSTCQIGEVLFLNHPDLYPIYWTDHAGSGTDMNKLKWHFGEYYDEDNNLVESPDWYDLGYACDVMASHKNFLFAMGMKEGSDYYADKVWWSHPAEPNGIPFSWRPTYEQPDSIAGWVNLGRGGSIIGGESLRDSFVVYSEEALNAFDFTGDALGWRRRTISTTAGLAGKEAVISIEGAHMFISPDDILMFDGNNVRSLMHNRIRKGFATQIDKAKSGTSWAAHYKTFNEVWFAVPEKGCDFPNIAYCYNYRDDTWSVRDLERQHRHGHFGDEPVASYTSWDESTGAWDDSNESWPSDSKRILDRAMFTVTGDEIFDVDPNVAGYGNQFADQRGATWRGIRGGWGDDVGTWSDIDPLYNYSQRPTVLSRTDMPIGGHEGNVTVTRVYPHVEGPAKRAPSWNSVLGSWGSQVMDWNFGNPQYNGQPMPTTLEFRFGSQQQAGGEIRWAGDFREFTPGVDRKIDVRTTGEMFCYQIRSKGGFFNLTGMDIEYKMAGAR